MKIYKPAICLMIGILLGFLRPEVSFALHELNTEYEYTFTIIPEARWSMNTYFDTEYPDLDYASDERIIFHGYFGLFVYDLNQEKIVYSLNLKKLNCQKVQTGGVCEVQVSSDGKEINLYPFQADFMYVYNTEKNVLKMTKRVLMKDSFEQLKVLRDIDLPIAKKLHFCSRNGVVFDDNTCGYLYFSGKNVSDIIYIRGNRSWQLLTENDKPLPDVLRQDDSFYEAHVLKANESYLDFINIYTAMYNIRDYAGVCALSAGLTYSDSMQENWQREKFKIMYGEELKTKENKKSCFKCAIQDENGKEEIRYLYLKADGDKWYADGLPKLTPPIEEWWDETDFN